MDSDEFDDGLADEDFLIALDGPASSNHHAGFAPSVKPMNGGQQNRPESLPVELEDLPSDAFSSPEPQLSTGRISAFANQPPQALHGRIGLQRSSSGSFRQTTLWGGEVARDELSQSQQSQAPLARVMYRIDQPREEPSHHALDKQAMKTWVYPTNLGATRDYQFSIVKNSLFNNTLVALPTGLGKTFIAATVMLNFHRWTTNAKIVFVAPTKPLVAQQVDACYNIAGIPRSETTLLTGDIPPALRVDEWEKRRVFFMTPQTLLNDLSHGYADPKSIALLVVDEAHRAVGEYAYAKVTKLIRRFSKSFRVLALTATPGSKIETVQEVIDNLGISHCEIRTEESLDIRQYVHQRNVEQLILDPSDEIYHISELFTKAIKPLTDKLSSQNIYYGRNPMAMTAFGLMQAQKEWFATRGQHTNQGVQFMMRAVFSVLTGLAHSIKLLNYHGIKPFYDNMIDFRSEQEGKGEKGSKYKRQLIGDSSFQEMMKKISIWIKKDGFVGHPKLTALADYVLNHFMDSGESSTTRVIVFSEYRDSAEEIVRTLNMHKPLVKASIFVGQADSKRGEGMKQTQQIQTIERFKKGDFNVLVATSIGEEGLDIGQVDLIVCYDSSASPIRMLQRMGRTGRKRAGNIVLLLMRGREEDQFAKSKDNYEKMQKLICEGSRFNFRFDLSSRIVPRDIRPEVDRRHIDIPIENTQDTSLPEPKKRRAPAGKKKPPKKFHMPDGVETGFQKVTDLLKIKGKAGRPKHTVNPELDDLASVPPAQSVYLNSDELKELNRSYRDLPFNHDVVEETDMPSMTSHPLLQRQLRPIVKLRHGTHTKRVVKLLRRMGMEADSLVKSYRDEDESGYREIPVKPFVDTEGEEEDMVHAQAEELAPAKPAKGRKRQAVGRPGTSRKSAGDSRQKRQKTSTAKTGAASARVSDSGAEQSDEGGDDVSKDATPPRKTKKKTTRRKLKKSENTGRGINSDEVGDDCERDSDLLDASDSDDGADLLDFVVSDNVASSNLMDSQATSPTTMSQSTPRSKVEKPYFAPTELPATQDSDGVPDLSSLVGIETKSASTTRREVDISDEETSLKRTVRSRRMVLFHDSDSDE